MISRQFTHLLQNLKLRSSGCRLEKSLLARSFSSEEIQQEVQPCEQFKFSRVNRSLIQLDGPECHDFLQGMITNDVRHLTGDGQTGVSRSCIYSFMLNSAGKILADCFVYRPHGQSNVLLLDVDSNLSTKIVALLKRYKIRRNVNINANPDYQVHAIFPEGRNVQLPGDHFQHSSDDIILVQDPRNHNFGYRMIYKSTQNKTLEEEHITDALAKHDRHPANLPVNRASVDDYEKFRYQTGFGEGSKDFIPETIFPFEANAELLNGVSFHKGCYIGQELTARTYHTGVIRKRLLPIKLNIAYDQGLEVYPVQNVITPDTNKILGRFRCNHGNIGLAILKFTQIFHDQSPVSEPMILSNAQVQIQAYRPFWWPNSLL